MARDLLGNRSVNLEKLGKSMLPKAPQTAQGDLFKSELAAIIDLSHPLARLASKIDCECLEKTLHPHFQLNRLEIQWLENTLRQ